MDSFNDLIAWQRARALALATYSATRGFPASEHFGLTAQMRRAAVSIAANLAEGTGRRSRGDQARFYGIALGSARELESHISIALALEFLQPNEGEALREATQFVQRVVSGLIKSCRR